MTVADLINEYNTLRSNRIDDSLKVKWLRILEKHVMVDVLRKYDGIRDDEPRHDNMWVDDDGILHVPSYMYVDENMNLVVGNRMETNLLSSDYYTNDDGTITIEEMSDDEFTMDSYLSVPEPYTDIYLHYLDMKCAYYTNDSKMYNNAAQEYNNAYLAFEQWMNRTHTPDRARVHIIDHGRL